MPLNLLVNGRELGKSIQHASDEERSTLRDESFKVGA